MKACLCNDLIMGETLEEVSASSVEMEQEDDLIEEHFEITEEIMPTSAESEVVYGSSANELPGVVVIAHDNSATVIPDGSEDPSNKRMYLESVGQDGQTYVLTLQNGTDGIPTQVEFDPKLQQIAVSSQVIDGTAGYPSEDSDVNQAWFTSREDKSSLQHKGHIWKQGMWSKEETDLLELNITSYCKDHNVTDPAEIIFEMTKDERKDFYRTVAKGLNRPLFSVYRRVIRMYDNKNHVGKYTPEEIDKLRELRMKHGNDWQTIGSVLGRSASSIKDRCRLMKDNCNTGKWLPSEEKRLTDAVYHISHKKPGEMVTSGISWSAVAEKVGTRSEKQCRTKWLNYLNWKHVGGSVWTREDDIGLVCKICSLHVEEENSIDWAELARGWPSVRSPQWLRGKWWNLKRLIPDIHLLTFKDICDYLYKNLSQTVKSKPTYAEASTETENETEIAVSSTLNVPRVSVVHTPNLVTAVPVHVQTEVPTTSSTATSTTDDEVVQSSQPQLGTFQTFEFIPPGVPLNPTNNSATFLITPGQAAIPFTTCTQNTPGQIIIHAVAAETVHGNENMTVQMNMPSQIIISTANHNTALGSVGTNLTGPIQLTRSLLQSADPLQISSISAHGGLLGATTGELLTSNLHSSKTSQSETDIGSQTDLINPSLETEEDEMGREVDNSVSQRNDKILERNTSSTSHLILCDPMLSSNNSPESIEITSDAECEKGNSNHDLVASSHNETGPIDQ